MGSKHIILNLVTGLLSLIAGVIALFYPGLSMLALGIMLAITVLLSGVTNIFVYLATPKPSRNTSDLIIAILIVLAAAWVLLSANMNALVKLVPYAAAIWILLYSLLIFTRSRKLYSAQVKGARLPYTLSMVGIIVGVIMLIFPAMGIFAINLLIAIAMIYQGINHLITFFELRKTQS